MNAYFVSWNSFDLSNTILAAILITSLLIVHKCDAGNDYDTHASTAGRAEQMFK